MGVEGRVVLVLRLEAFECDVMDVLTLFLLLAAVLFLLVARYRLRELLVKLLGDDITEENEL